MLKGELLSPRKRPSHLAPSALLSAPRSESWRVSSTEGGSGTRRRADLARGSAASGGCICSTSACSCALRFLPSSGDAGFEVGFEVGDAPASPPSPELVVGRERRGVCGVRGGVAPPADDPRLSEMRYGVMGRVASSTVEEY